MNSPTLLQLVETAVENLPARTREPQADDYQFLPTRDGGLSLKVRGRWLHSRRDPWGETARRVQALGPVPPDAPILCLGMGIGYEVIQLRRTYPESPLIILCPYHPYLLALGTHRTALAEILEVPLENISFHLIAPDISQQQLSDLVQTVLSDYTHRVITHFETSGFFFYGESWRAAVLGTLERISSRRQVNSATIKRFARLWVRNTMLNLPLYGRAGRVESLQQRFSGIPSLLVAAGPTLEEFLPRLAELSVRFLIVAVDTALPALERAGVTPDIVIVVDPQYWNTRHLDYSSLDRTLVISEISSHPRALRGCKHLVLTGSLLPLGSSFEQKLEGFTQLGAGGSVATTAWDLCRHLGCSSITLLGLDLGFPNMQTHILGSLSEELMVQGGTRLKPTETQSYGFLLGGAPGLVSDHVGRPLLSDKRMDIYAGWFENRISEMQNKPGFEVMRLGSRGRFIGKFPSRTVPELLEYPIIRSSIDERMQEIKAYLHSHASPQRKDGALLDSSTASDIPRAIMADIYVNAEGLMALTRRAIAALIPLLQGDSGSSTPEHDPRPQEVLASLEEADQAITSLSHTRVVGMLMQEILESTVNQPPARTFRESLERSRDLYEGLHDAAQWLLSIIEKSRNQTP